MSMTTTEDTAIHKRHVGYLTRARALAEAVGDDVDVDGRVVHQFEIALMDLETWIAKQHPGAPATTEGPVKSQGGTWVNVGADPFEDSQLAWQPDAGVVDDLTGLESLTVDGSMGYDISAPILRPTPGTPAAGGSSDDTGFE